MSKRKYFQSAVAFGDGRNGAHFQSYVVLDENKKLPFMKKRKGLPNE